MRSFDTIILKCMYRLHTVNTCGDIKMFRNNLQYSSKYNIKRRKHFHRFVYKM